MDSRAKQRLTGAVILVALFVLLVPELLTGPRKAGSDAPNDEGMRRYTIDIDAPPNSTQPMTETDPRGAVALPPVTDAAPAAPDARAVPGEAAQPAATTPAPAATTASAPPAPAPAAAASPSPAVSTAAPAAAASAPAQPPRTIEPPAKPVTARADTPRPAPAAPSPRGGFAVQLGSFVSKENAERLVRDMNAKGFNAFLAPPIMTGGRELFRVRVGPTRDRAAAEALAAQLRRIGQVGSVVTIS